jgi:hypothetical protein
MSDQWDAEQAEQLALSAADGSVEAARDLIGVLWPMWLRLVKASPAMRGMQATDDDVANVLLRLVEKIKNGRSLGLYAPWRERNPDKSFADWVRIVTANAVRDYVKFHSRRPRLELDGDEGTVASPKRVLNEFMRSPAS